ncbi:short-chain dehydrogenase, partial [Salmonella enterica subsp. enterica serovar Typhimurium]|nr:short-chain dehydrogenase [Salmonella enterica subsp. enterica serovar Typhimurium]
ALPAPVFDRTMDVLGVNATMDGFTGRRSRLFAGRETAR